MVAAVSSAQAQTGSLPKLITQPVNESQRVTLVGNTHPLARPEFDQGPAPATLPLDRMLLVLRRGPQQQAALNKLLEEQQQKSSPNFHRWLTPEEFGRQFGLDDEDLDIVTAWLESHGFQLGRIAKGRTVIEFSGTAAQLQSTFHTAIHSFLVNGKQHWANVNDPQIPMALLPAIAGIASLHTFFSEPQVAISDQQIQATLRPGSPSPQFTSGSSYLLAPADYATIYNINPVYEAGVTGTGTVIAVVGRTDINIQDVVSFRSVFGLTNNPPQMVIDGPDPGDLGGGEETEAVLDTTWAGAVAPGAQVILVVSQSTNTTDGVSLSEEYIIDNNLGNVMTESFGDCEANYTASQAANISSLAQQAAALGITYMVSAGDAGSAGCDNFDTETSATGPISVNILASTPYTLAVGGTQFNDNANPATYWSSQNGSSGGSALSYIPEDVWNANCIAASCGTGSILAGGGGVSQFFTKPAWQTGVAGIPKDGARDVPDVALAAAGHTPYLLCLDGSCTPNSSGQITLYGVYGTSAAAPSFAGIMALINQKTASRQGQAAPVFYRLASGEKLSNCNASNIAGLPGSACIFNDVTVGTNAVPGESGYNTSSETYQAGTGYDLASGLGSVNVANLVDQWSGGAGSTVISVFPTSTTPSAYYADSNAVELGVKLRSDISGYITGIRFYKNSADTSLHTGSLWSAGGALLATGTFSNETPGGWQQLMFSTPVAIQANTTYIASYHTSSGFYAALNYFASQGANNGTLHELESGVDGLNGVYNYGPGGIFPAQSYEDANYWVDVVFSPTSMSAPVAANLFGTAAPSSQFFANSSGVELGVKIRSDVSGYITGIRFYKNSTDTTTHTGSLWSESGTLLATGTFTGETASGWQQLNFPAPVAIASNTTYVASYHTGSGFYASLNFFSASGFDNGTLHALESGVDGLNGVYDYGPGGVFPNQTYENSNYWVDVVFSQNGGASSANIFSASTTPYQFFANSSAVELAVKFRSDVSGHVSGIRFYKNASDTSVHTGSLWTDSGTLLASGTFTETASGWQQLNFSSPVAIAADTTYVASYHTGSGFYAGLGFFSTGGFDNGVLHALQQGIDGPNGLYYYGSGGIFPNQTYQNSNYWVDVVFSSP